MGKACTQSHYEILGVPDTATLADIRRAYRAKALAHHPDKDSSENATIIFQRIQEAYEVLGSARNRLIYDAGNSNLAQNETARLRAEQDREVQRSIAKNRLMEACKAGATFDVMKLLRGACLKDLNAFDESGHTMLMYAAQGQHAQVVSLLIIYQADVNTTNSDGWGPLMFALSAEAEDSDGDHSKASCALELLKGKANANAKTSTGITALLFASATGRLAMVRALLAHMADFTVIGDSGATPLILAADGGHVAVVRALLDVAACVDVFDSEGRTALMSASAALHDDVVEVLLEATADASAKAVDGATALLLVLECLGDADVDDNAKQESGLTIARMLLEARAAPDARADHGRTPLELAKGLGNQEIMSSFLSTSISVLRVAESGG